MAHFPIVRTNALLPVAICLGLFLAPISAHAKGGADPYDAARDAEGRLDYKAVVRNASEALESAQTHDRLVQLYRMLGTAQGVLGKSQEAVDAFTKLIGIDPEHKLARGTSPKITTPFREAGGFWVDRPQGLTVTPTVSREIASGKSLSIPVKVDDPLNITANVRLSYRIQGDAEWKKQEAQMGPAVTFNLSADELPTKDNDYILEVYFAALNAQGSELRLSGEAARPLTIAVRVPGSTKVVTTTAGGDVIVQPAKPKKPLIKTWWFWTIIGGVVVVGAGLGGGLGYAFGRPDTSKVDGTFSTRAAVTIGF